MTTISANTHLIIPSEETLDDLQSLVVNGLVLVRLESLDPVKTPALLHHHGDLVHLPELLGGGEDVGDAVQHHADNLVVLGSQQVTERLEDSLHQQNE